MNMVRIRSTPPFVTSRYLIREFLGIFVPIVLTFVLLYVVVDFFDRLTILLKNHAPATAALRYFLFKIPLMVTQIMPPAVLTAMLVSLGMLSRRNEIIALRASGVSLYQMAVPLLGLAALISLGTLVWNETVVPYCTREYQYVNNVEIRKRAQRGILNEREIWYHGADGFYNIDHIDARRQMLFGVTIYRTDTKFDLHTIVNVASAQWTDDGWVTADAVARTVTDDGTVVTERLDSHEVLMHETLNDFLEVRRDADELSYLALRQRIQELTRKGIDTANYLVDLHLKLAVPFASFVLACVAVPLAGRVQRHPSVAAILLAGLVVGFAYWVVLALTNSLGESGVLPAVVSAWASNVVFLLLGVALFLSTE
jgi:lipopolysaccharide export system permease protein